jgi:hypothetical protein
MKIIPQLMLMEGGENPISPDCRHTHEIPPAEITPSVRDPFKKICTPERMRYPEIYKQNQIASVQKGLIQQQEDQTNTNDNIPPIEEAMERKPYGLRIF